MASLRNKVFLILLLVWIRAVTTKACIYNSDPNYFSCSERGIFPNYNDDTCTTYYSCIKYSLGFYQNLITCNEGTFFNRNTNMCDWYYKCPCAIEETTTTEAALQALIQPDCLENTTAAFNCSTDTKSGCYANPSDPFCEKYISCYVTASGKVYQQERTCAKGTFFNAGSDVCGCSVANGYRCPCKRG